MGERHFLYAHASDSELNELIRGRASADWQPWPFRGLGLRQSRGSVGVLWKEPSPGALVRPLALVVDTPDLRRLFARFAQVRSDLSPLSTWCHIFSPSLFASLREPMREADLGGLEASWAGLVIAEAMVLSDRPVSQLKLAACLATQTYAIARTLAIWPGVSVPDVVARYEALQRIIRLGGPHNVGWSNFASLWAPLASLSLGYDSPTGPFGAVAGAMMSLKRARETGTNEILALESVFGHLPEATFLSGLADASPEDRLKAFDILVERIGEERSSSALRVELAFLAGYLTTVAAGGAASLDLASKVTHIAPEVSGWAYLIGGLGERVTWSGGFSGLGRLVARELLRPFRLDDPPSADFAADEADVLVDKQLVDPLVHLQLKQSRIATAAIFPGVNLQVPFAEQTVEPRHQLDNKQATPPITSARASAAEDALQAFANALAPLILDRVRDQLPLVSRERGSKGKWPKASQRKLPLAGDE
jgi:hypothetical protein